MGKSIGIDLGTTNSVAAIKRIQTDVLANSEGDLITPSCVTVKKRKIPFKKPEFIVGKNAIEWIKQDPENTIVAIKRLMGRSMNEKEVKDIIQDKKLRYQIKHHSRGTQNSLAVLLNGKEYTPEEISSQILSKIKKDAEAELKNEISYAVITVPAYFNDKQKHATRTAAALAGIKVQRLLPEPTAAAISFGVDHIKGDDAKTILIFDFGGGTFDLSVLTISGGQFIEQGKGGDMWMGGEDIDRIIAEYILNQTAEENEIDDIGSTIEMQDKKSRNRFLGELKEKVEQAKIRLSSENEAYIQIPGALKDQDGDVVDVDVTLTRDILNDLIADIINKSINLTQKILDSIHITPDLVDNVLLVGGSSKIPSIIEAMKQKFGDEKVLVHDRPMLAIAEGAAILSHRLADSFECPKCGQNVNQSDSTCSSCQFDLEQYVIDHSVLDIVHSAAHDYYLYLENNEKFLFIEKNTPLPFERTEVFKMVHKDQRMVHMKFVNMVNDVEEFIGDLWLGLDREIDNEETEKDAIKKDSTLQVEITLKIDENNIIEVAAAIKEQPEIRLSKTLSRGKADEKLFIELESLINDVNEKRYNEYIIIDVEYRTISAIKDIHNIVDPNTGEINEPLYNKAELKIEKARRLSENNLTGKSMIYYADEVLRSFGPAIPPKEKKNIHDKVKHLELMDENGTYDQNVKAINELNSVLDNLGVVNILMEIQKAGSIMMEINQSKAPKFFRYIKEILEAFSEQNENKATRLLEEIMPETMAVIKEHDNQSGMIYKDIKR